MTRAEELAEKVARGILNVKGSGDTAVAALSELELRALDRDAMLREANAVRADAEALAEALGEVVKQFNLWSEDANDGTYAYYKSDGLMVACVKARDALARYRGEK